MYRVGLALLPLLLLGGCGTSPTNSETTREVVLQYLGGDVGTAGPFGKGGKKELDVLTPADRQAAEALIDRGAAMFLVYGANAANAADAQAAAAGGATRVVLVQGGRVVGDFRAQPKS